jgi:uncharacterized protein
MVLWQRVKDIFYKAIHSNSSPQKLALSFSLGLFIAFSPFPFAHTIMVFAIHWVLSLNFPILFVITSINNPWTMVPFYACDYSFGHWFVHSFLGRNPSWVISLEKIFGSGKICIWSFFVGGMVLGIVTAALSYPIMLWVFGRAISNREKL